MDHTFKKLISIGINSDFPKHEFTTTQPTTSLMRQTPTYFNMRRISKSSAYSLEKKPEGEHLHL